MSELSGCQPTPKQAEKLVLETIDRVQQLARLAAKFPEPFRQVARGMPAWPVMQFKRETGHNFYWHVLSKLELGEDYPIDIGHHARSHPSSAMGQYLTRCVERLHQFKRHREWLDGTDGPPCPELTLLLELTLKTPPLTKATSEDWSRRIMVPLIMLSDAGSDEATCKEPALLAIWRQRGVKSRATFKSRLLTKVRQSLHSLAKAA